MSADQVSAGGPVATSGPGDPRRAARAEPRPWSRGDGMVLGLALAVLVVLAWTLTDLGPAVVGAACVIAFVTMRRETPPHGRSAWLVSVLQLLVGTAVLLSTGTRGRTGAEVAAQLGVGALVGVAVLAVAAVVRRRRAAPEGPPTGA